MIRLLAHRSRPGRGLWPGPCRGSPQRRRQFFDPRRFRPQCRRRSRQRHHAGRSRQRRACLCAGAGGRENGRGCKARHRQRPWVRGLVAAAVARLPAARRLIVTATAGIAPLKLGAEADPHAWQSVANAKIYVANIRDALVAADPADAEAFKSNASAYLAELDALDREVREAIAKIPRRPPQGDLDPRCLRLFRRRLWHRIHRAARRLDRIRGQRPRHRRDHHPDQGRQNTGRVSGKYQRPPADAAGYRPRPAPGSAERSIPTA